MKNLTNNNWFWVGVIFLITFVIYLVLVQAWKFTSPEFPPANAIDLEVRLPEDKDDWLVRRENGVCPFDASQFDLKDPFKGFRDC